jgi:diamine N-acetyltransferase
MHIRKATANDLQTLIALNRFVQQQHAKALPHHFKKPQADPHTIRMFRNLIKDSQSFVFLAEDEEPAGYVYAQFQERSESWIRPKSRALYVHHIVVAPKFRRCGVGSALFASVREVAKKKKVERLELDVWFFNTEARKFFAKLGFQISNEKMELVLPR